MGGAISWLRAAGSLYRPSPPAAAPGSGQRYPESEGWQTTMATWWGGNKRYKHPNLTLFLPYPPLSWQVLPISPTGQKARGQRAHCCPSVGQPSREQKQGGGGSGGAKRKYSEHSFVILFRSYCWCMNFYSKRCTKRLGNLPKIAHLVSDGYRILTQAVRLHCTRPISLMSLYYNLIY